MFQILLLKPIQNTIQSLNLKKKELLQAVIWIDQGYKRKSAALELFTLLIAQILHLNFSIQLKIKRQVWIFRRVTSLSVLMMLQTITFICARNLLSSHK